MKFTAQEEYGVRCLLQIARSETGFLTIGAIAKKEALTPFYVAKLMRILRQKGIVRSVRGQKGGYELARPAGEIDMLTTLNALGERPFSDEFCQHYTGTRRVCIHDTDCSIRSLWVAIDRIVGQVFSKTTLDEMICRECTMRDRMKEKVLTSQRMVRVDRGSFEIH